MTNNTTDIDHQLPSLKGLWLFWGSLLILLFGITLFFDLSGDQYRWQTSEAEPVFLRTIFYAITIATFPLSSLLRHIMIRLNETMPGSVSAKARYVKTVLISMLFALTISGYGIGLYLYGDTLNTLYIFNSLSALAVWLYRPKYPEYQQIIEALNSRVDE